MAAHERQAPLVAAPLAPPYDARARTQSLATALGWPGAPAAHITAPIEPKVAEAKIVPSLLQELKALPPDAELSVIVLYKPSAFSPRALVPGTRPRRVYELIPAMALSARGKAIHVLDEDPRVEKIWPDLPVHTCLDVAAPQVGVPRLWELGLTGKGIRLAILDTGLDAEHPDFGLRLRARESFVDRDPSDGNGHGTHVAGVAAGSGEASQGRYRGIAPEADLYIAKVLRDDGSGATSDVMAALDWAVRQQPHVINLSLGGSPTPADGSDPLSTMCNAAVEKGFVVCCAAGNSGPASYTVGAPGAARLVITVGAVDDSDRIAPFSSRGPTADGRVKPDLVMPGVSIISARARGTQMGSIVNEHYTQASGTSMATPLLSGAVALLLQHDPGHTPAEVKSLLTGSALSIGEPENTQGSGRADVYRAYLGQPSPRPVQPSPQPLPRGCTTAVAQALAVMLGMRTTGDRSR